MQTAKKPLQSVQMSQTYQVPVEKVYQAWIKPEVLQQWFGCSDMTTQNIELDVRVGGQWKWVSKSKEDGHITEVHGQYEEVIPNQKLVFTWNLDGKVFAEDTLVTVLFRDLGDSTELTLIHDQFADEAMVEPHKAGWNKALDGLATYLKK